SFLQNVQQLEKEVVEPLRKTAQAGATQRIVELIEQWRASKSITQEIEADKKMNVIIVKQSSWPFTYAQQVETLQASSTNSPYFSQPFEVYSNNKNKLRTKAIYMKLLKTKLTMITI